MNAPEQIRPPSEQIRPSGEEILAGETSSPIVEFSPTAAALADLARRYHGRVYQVDTPAGMKAAIAGRRELRELRTAIEARRAELKAPILERGRLIDAEAKRITAHLAALEDPIDDQIKAEERRAEQEREAAPARERARLAAIDQRIAWVRERPVAAARMRTAAELQAELDGLRAVPIGREHYAEKLDEAGTVHGEAVEAIEAMLARAREREAEEARLAEQRAELARQEAEARVAREEEDRLRREQQEREDRERRERQAREDRERAERIAAEEAERARARAAEEARLEAARAEQERRDREAREAREREEAAARAAREQQEREAAERRRAEREAVERAADPWDALWRIQRRAERALSVDGPREFAAALEEIHAAASTTFAARAKLEILPDRAAP